MKPPAGYLLLASDAVWRLCSLPAQMDNMQDFPLSGLPTPDQLEEKKELVRQQLSAVQYAGEPVMLAIPASWCLCSTVSMANLPRRQSRAAMLYRLEEVLPLSAEDLVADFAPAVADHCLAICAEIPRLQPVVGALERAGLMVQHIVPAALLALQHLLADAATPESDAVLWQHDSHLHLFTTAGRKLKYWAVLPANARDISLHLSVEALKAKAVMSLTVVNLADDISNAVAAIPGINVVHTSGEQLDRAAALAGAQVLLGERTAPIDLRRDALADVDPNRAIRTPLRVLQIAAAVCVVLLCAGMLIRARQYEERATAFETAQATVFKQTIPRQNVPTNIRLRLESEEQRWRGLSGESTDLPRTVPLLTVMRDAILAMPQNLRYRVVEIRVSPDKLFMEGQARVHSDADAIAVALRTLPNLVVEPPRTEQLSDRSVGFTLSASVAPRPATTQKAGRP